MRVTGVRMFKFDDFSYILRINIDFFIVPSSFIGLNRLCFAGGISLQSLCVVMLFGLLLDSVSPSLLSCFFALGYPKKNQRPRM